MMLSCNSDILSVVDQDELCQACRKRKFWRRRFSICECIRNCIYIIMLLSSYEPFCGTLVFFWISHFYKFWHFITKPFNHQRSLKVIIYVGRAIFFIHFQFKEKYTTLFFPQYII